MSRDSRDAIRRSSPSALNRPSSMATSTSRLLNADTGSIIILIAAPPPGLDHPVGLQLGQVFGAERQPLLVDLGVVLAEERRRTELGRRLRELYGVAGHRERAPARMLNGLHHAARLQVRIVQDLPRGEAGAGGDAGLAELGHDLVLGAGERPLLYQRVDLGLVGGTPFRIRPLGMADQVVAADGAEQR